MGCFTLRALRLKSCFRKDLCGSGKSRLDEVFVSMTVLSALQVVVFNINVRIRFVLRLRSEQLASESGDDVGFGAGVFVVGVSQSFSGGNLQTKAVAERLISLFVGSVVSDLEVVKMFVEKHYLLTCLLESELCFV